MADLKKRIHFFDIEFIGYGDDGDQVLVRPLGVMRHVARLPIASPNFGSGFRYMPIAAMNLGVPY